MIYRFYVQDIYKKKRYFFFVKLVNSVLIIFDSLSIFEDVIIIIESFRLFRNLTKPFICFLDFFFLKLWDEMLLNKFFCLI